MDDKRVWILVALSVILLVTFFVTWRRKERIARLLFRISELTIAALIVFTIMRLFIIQNFVIPSESMVPTLLVSDQLVVNKLLYKFRQPRFKEVIVFRAPRELQETEDEEDFIKRVIGVPGDRIVIYNETVYRNGKALNEPYINEAMIGSDMPEMQVPEGKVFVMGDNRNDSFDSRDWGCLDMNLIIGRATFVYWPGKRMGYIR